MQFQIDKYQIDAQLWPRYGALYNIMPITTTTTTTISHLCDDDTNDNASIAFEKKNMLHTHRAHRIPK